MLIASKNKSKNKLLHLSYMRANDLRFAFDIVFWASTWYSKNGSEEAGNRSSTIRAWSLAQRNCTISHRWFLISHCNKVHKTQVFKQPTHNIHSLGTLLADILNFLSCHINFSTHCNHPLSEKWHSHSRKKLKRYCITLVPF